jgi:AraC-like DNA-binding protein
MQNMLDRLADGRSFSRAASHPSGLAEAVRIEPPRPAGTGYEDAYLSSPEFLITVKQIRARRAFVDDEPGLGRLVFVFHLQGRRTIELAGIGRYELTRPTFAAYYQAEGVRKRSSWAEGDSETAVLVGFWPQDPPRILRGLMSECSEWRSMFAIGERPFVWFQQPLSLEMEQAARHILGPKVHPAVLPDFLNAKAGELLCLGFDVILSALDVTKEDEGGLGGKVRHAQRLVDSHIPAMPSVSDLAREVSLTPTALSAAFRDQNGVSIAEYAAGQRMRRAHHLLASTALPLKQIAHELGYNHTSNFCLAFKRHFGITPRQARYGADAGKP